MNLLQIHDESIVSKTTLSRKLTLGGVTNAYPVYRVRLDQLFYNDQNDRIATWITQYKNDTSNISFSELSREEYNKIIEQFIIDSNPAAIEKTKNNINISCHKKVSHCVFCCCEMSAVTEKTCFLYIGTSVFLIYVLLTKNI